MTSRDGRAGKASASTLPGSAMLTYGVSAGHYVPGHIFIQGMPAYACKDQEDSQTPKSGYPWALLVLHGYLFTEKDA